MNNQDGNRQDGRGKFPYLQNNRWITVGKPTYKDRIMILRVHSRSKPLADDVDLEKIAAGTPGFTGADLERLLNEAELIAARRQRKAISADELDQARDKVLMGLERASLMLTDEEKKTVSYHEAGHALAAEENLLHKITNGAENDLRDGTDLARKMIARWGMSRQLGAFSLADQQDQVFLGESLGYRRRYSEGTAKMVDEEVKSLLDECYAKAAEIIIENREILDKIAVRLREHEEMSGDEVLQLVENSTKADSGVRASR